MIIAFAGDFHVHNWPQFARPWMEGLNSRARDIFEVVGVQIPQELEQHGARVLVHTGDWNWTATNDYRLVNLTRDAGFKCESKVERVIALHGNHDTTSSDPESHNAFPYLHNPIWKPVALNDVLFFPIGYNDPLPAIHSLGPAAKYKRVLFILHKDIEGGETSSGFIYRDRGAVKISELLALKKTLPQAEFLAGHYHKRQVIGKLVRVVGAPVQHNRGDEGSVRGVTFYDSDTNLYEFVACRGPEFATGDVSFAEHLMVVLTDWERERVYVTINVPVNDASAYRKAEELIRMGLNAVIQTIGEEQRESQQVANPVSAFSSDPELLSKWFTEREPDLSGEERSELIDIALQL